MGPYTAVRNMLNLSHSENDRHNLPELPRKQGNRTVAKMLLWLMSSPDGPMGNLLEEVPTILARQALQKYADGESTPEHWEECARALGDTQLPESERRRNGVKTAKKALDAVASMQARDDDNGTALQERWKEAWKGHYDGHRKMPDEHVATDVISSIAIMQFEAGGQELEAQATSGMRKALGHAATWENQPTSEDQVAEIHRAAERAGEYPSRVNHELRATQEATAPDGELERAGRDTVRAIARIAGDAAELAVMRESCTGREPLFRLIRAGAGAGYAAADAVMTAALLGTPESRYAANSERDEPERLRRVTRLLRTCRAGTDTALTTMAQTMEEAHQGLQNLRIARRDEAGEETSARAGENAAWEAGAAVREIRRQTLKTLQTEASIAQQMLWK